MFLFTTAQSLKRVAIYKPSNLDKGKGLCKLECLKVILFGEEAIGLSNSSVDICCVIFLNYYISLLG